MSQEFQKLFKGIRNLISTYDFLNKVSESNVHGKMNVMYTHSRISFILKKEKASEEVQHG